MKQLHIRVIDSYRKMVEKIHPELIDEWPIISGYNLKIGKYRGWTLLVFEHTGNPFVLTIPFEYIPRGILEIENIAANLSVVRKVISRHFRLSLKDAAVIVNSRRSNIEQELEIIMKQHESFCKRTVLKEAGDNIEIEKKKKNKLERNNKKTEELQSSILEFKNEKQLRLAETVLIEDESTVQKGQMRNNQAVEYPEIFESKIESVDKEFFGETVEQVEVLETGFEEYFSENSTASVDNILEWIESVDIIKESAVSFEQDKVDSDIPELNAVVNENNTLEEISEGLKKIDLVSEAEKKNDNLMECEEMNNKDIPFSETSLDDPEKFIKKTGKKLEQINYMKAPSCQEIFVIKQPDPGESEKKLTIMHTKDAFDRKEISETKEKGSPSERKEVSKVRPAKKAAHTARTLSQKELVKANSGPSVKIIEEQLPNRKKVFVIHGANKKINNSLHDFLNSIGLQPVGFDDMFGLNGDHDLKASEMLITVFKNVQAVLSVLTPAEAAVKKHQTKYFYNNSEEKPPKFPLRTNVLLSTGMALALNRERTIVVEIGELNFYKDLTGIQTINMDNSPVRRKELLDKLSAVGCDVDAASKDWLSSGDFSDSLQLDLNKKLGSPSRIYKVIKSKQLFSKIGLKNKYAEDLNSYDSENIFLEKKDAYINMLSHEKSEAASYLEPILKDKKIVVSKQTNLTPSVKINKKDRLNEEVKYLKKMEQLQDQLKILKDNKLNKKKIAVLEKQLELEKYRYRMLQQLWIIEDLG
ncbi:MAG: hypothetical protein XD78_0950 [Desulfotomaculum sp. 46_296]|nr:MAG: hypothetical protein XD78_0950 [Desulfotomaculum sp. 46_296]HAU32106.1 hypothetical protein [Desulfotomaculum sp.]